jgi:hypothetical protein
MYLDKCSENSYKGIREHRLMKGLKSQFDCFYYKMCVLQSLHNAMIR